MRLLLLLFIFCNDVNAQLISIKKGDKYIMTKDVFRAISEPWASSLKAENFNLNNIWTVKNEDQYMILFVDSKLDSFWYSKRGLYSDSVRYRAFTVSLLNKYIREIGRNNLNKIVNGDTWYGMTKNQLIMSIGNPDDVNITKTAHRVDEQWIYGSHKSIYYYFTNNRLTAIQY